MILMQYIFRFPGNIERREKWFYSIGTINAYEKKRICSDHFTEDDYYICDTFKILQEENCNSICFYTNVIILNKDSTKILYDI